jgi:NADPH-dependent 2,4-dienoyl-CoA reductase/sulfur reductase-like enzyme
MSMPQQLVIVGGSDAGISAALRAREVAPEWEVTLLVADAFPNFSICGLPYYLGGAVPDWHALAHRTRDEIEAQGIHLRLNVTATTIDPSAHTVTVSEAFGHTDTLPYDRLIVGTGAVPRRPPIRGLEALLGGASTVPHQAAQVGANEMNTSGVYVLHSMEESFAVAKHLERRPPRRAIIIGGGYIGLEMAEALTERGIPTTLLQRASHVHPGVDAGIGARLRALLERHGVTVEAGVEVTEITPANDASAVAGYEAGDLLVRGTARGLLLPTDGTLDGRQPGRPMTTGPEEDAHPRHWVADLVLVATGVRPETQVARTAGVEVGAGGAIRVTRGMETGVADVFAAGDCVETYHRLLPTPIYLPLGTTAHKQGRVAGENAVGGYQVFAGVVGTQAVKVFEAVVARTGLLEAEARAAGYDPFTIELTTWDHKVYFPNAHELHVRLTGDRQSGLLLGTQLLGRWGDEVSKRIDIVATALHQYLRVDELNELDLSYTPPLSSPWDPVQMAAQRWQVERARVALPTTIPRP